MTDVENFKGVYSSDNIPKPMCFPAYLVVNFSPSYSPGSHFVTIIFPQKGKCIYFDPLDLKFIPVKMPTAAAARVFISSMYALESIPRRNNRES